jgi:hypothetical protein
MNSADVHLAIAATFHELRRLVLGSRYSLARTVLDLRLLALHSLCLRN